MSTESTKEDVQPAGLEKEFDEKRTQDLNSFQARRESWSPMPSRLQKVWSSNVILFLALGATLIFLWVKSGNASNPPAPPDTPDSQPGVESPAEETEETNEPKLIELASHDALFIDNKLIFPKTKEYKLIFSIKDQEENNFRDPILVNVSTTRGSLKTLVGDGRTQEIDIESTDGTFSLILSAGETPGDGTVVTKVDGKTLGEYAFCIDEPKLIATPDIYDYMYPSAPVEIKIESTCKVPLTGNINLEIPEDAVTIKTPLAQTTEIGSATGSLDVLPPLFLGEKEIPLIAKVENYPSAEFLGQTKINVPTVEYTLVSKANFYPTGINCKPNNAGAALVKEVREGIKVFAPASLPVGTGNEDICIPIKVNVWVKKEDVNTGLDDNNNKAVTILPVDGSIFFGDTPTYQNILLSNNFDFPVELCEPDSDLEASWICVQLQGFIRRTNLP